MTVVVGTAGHIDHGKTTLLRALTGIDADRLPEERARGMTIDVGYAHLALDDGTEIDFVDVPGHDRLVGNMLVGAGEIDAALLVVAADDGPRAQTIEHLQLLDALVFVHGIVVITKVDAVEPGRVVKVAEAVRALLGATTLSDAPVVAVSAQTGLGLPLLRVALIELRDRVVASDRDGTGPARLAIDRVFLIKGRGTVVTGSLRRGRIARGDTLRVVPGPDGATARVREVQVHGETVESAGPGRVALNIAGGESVELLARGVVLTADPAVTASDRLLVALRPIAPLGTARRGSGHPADRTRVATYAGTAHVAAIVGRSGRDAIDLVDREATAILRLAHPIAVAPGDRFAFRRQSPAEPLGGGRVLDPHPPRRTARRRSTPDRLRALAATQPGSVAWTAARLDLHGALTLPAPGLARDVADAVDAALLAAADKPDARRTEVLLAGSIELRRRVGSPGAGTDGLVAGRLNELDAGDQLISDDDRIRLPGAATAEPNPETLAAMDRLEERLTAVAPPTLSVAAREAGCPPDGIRALERANRIVRLDNDLAWAFATYRDLAGRALEMARSAPLTPAAYRDATGTSRKYVLAILEDLDRRAILRRTPEGHVPGPRAPQPAQPATTGQPG